METTMKKDNPILHILFVLSIILLTIGLLVLSAITSRKADLALLWPWLLSGPIGSIGILVVAREYNQK
jgi:hypothetical protein